MKRICFVFIFCISMSMHGQCQDNSFRAMLRLRFLPIERVQMGGNIDTKLPTHFSNIRLFDLSTRFAPDEPSSFSSLEYSFWEKAIAEKVLLELSVGFYRSHIKGDFLPKGKEAIHFGLGNSQVGPSASIAIHYLLYGQWSIGGAMQLGAGIHFSRWQSGDREIEPSEWGVVGFGQSNNYMVFMQSPTFWNRLSLRALVAYDFLYSRYRDFEVREENGEISRYSELKFSTRSKRPVFSVAVGFDLLKSK